MHAYSGEISPLFFFLFVSQQGTDKSYPCATAHEAQTTQTVNQLSFGAIREDPKGLAAPYTLASRAALFQALVREWQAQQRTSVYDRHAPRSFVTPRRVDIERAPQVERCIR